MLDKTNILLLINVVLFFRTVFSTNTDNFARNSIFYTRSKIFPQGIVYMYYIFDIAILTAVFFPVDLCPSQLPFGFFN